MIDELILKTTEYFTGDAKRIQHFMKVYGYAALIGNFENLPFEIYDVLVAAAVVHDTGIKKSEEIYGYNNGKLQEQYGPECAKPLLEACGYNKEQIERALYLVAHHHTYTNIEGIDYQILVEADFIVNMYEDNLDKAAVRTTYEKIFKTDSGKKLCKTIFGL